MHLSPLFSSKKIVLSPLSTAGFFFTAPGLCNVMAASHPFPILDPSAVHATDMRDASLVCCLLGGTPPEFAARAASPLGLARLPGGLFFSHFFIGTLIWRKKSYGKHLRRRLNALS
jgi:hypothetical protein